MRLSDESLTLKKDLRQWLYRHRRDLTQEEAQQVAQSLCEQVLALSLIPKAAVVGGYRVLRGEIDLCLLLEALVERGHRCCVPHVLPHTRVMTFKELGSETHLIPDVLLIPMVAFDAKGYRLGRGGGHYDATLDSLRTTRHPLAVGVAFDWQEIEEVPVEAHDQQMDFIVTSTRVFRFT